MSNMTKDGREIVEMVLNGKVKLMCKKEGGGYEDIPDELTDDPDTYCHVDFTAGNTEYKETGRSLIKIGRGNVLGVHTYDNIKNGNSSGKVKCVSVINWKPVPNKGTWMPSTKWGGYGKLSMPISKLKEIMPELNKLVK